LRSMPQLFNPCRGADGAANSVARCGGQDRGRSRPSLTMPIFRVLIIAYGNPLRCDDGVAWRVADKLSLMNLPGDIEIITRQLLPPELALPVSQAAHVLFIDAARESAPGEIASRRIEPQRLCSAFTHQLSPGAVLTAA